MALVTLGGILASSLSISSNLEKIEIYHFHTNNQCPTCKTIGEFSEETVNTYFSEELKTGKLIFDHINIDLPENKAISKKYEAKGSSLIIGVYDKNGKFIKQEDTRVWYKIGDKQEFMNYLKGEIESKLMGK